MGLDVVALVTEKENYNIHCHMKNLFTVTIILGLLFPIVMDAQTIYHYKVVATADKKKQIREPYYGERYVHIIFSGNNACIVNERGIMRSSETRDEKSIIPSFGPTVARIVSYEGGAQDKFVFQYKENGMLIYICHYHEVYRYKYDEPYTHQWRAGDISRDYEHKKYLYVSEDRTKANLVEPLPYEGCTGNYYSKGKEIEILELFDTDDKSALQETKESDYSHPGRML